jgi:hypothetical protein
LKFGDRSIGTTIAPMSCMTFTVKNIKSIISNIYKLSPVAIAAFVGATGCNGGDRANNGGTCPDDEVCSSKTPEGLYFRSYGYANRLLDNGPEVTAIGGSQTVDLYSKALISLPLSFTFGVDAGNSVAAAVKGPHLITLTGVKLGSNYVRITDPDDGTLFDRISVGAAAISRITVSGAQEPTTDPVIAFTAQSKLAIELFDKDDRHLIDEAAMISGPTITRSNQWDTATFVGSVPPGNQAITVTAGDKPAATLEVRVVARAEQVAAIAPPTQLFANESAIVCFRASTGNARVVGLPWSFTINGVVANDTLTRNCTSVGLDQPGTATVVATAGDVSTTLAIPVVIKPSRRSTAQAGHSIAVEQSDLVDDSFATAGERAQASLLLR